MPTARVALPLLHVRAFGSLDGARNVAQRKLARIAAGLVLGAIVLSSGAARADERTEARAHFKKGMAEIADGQLRRRHRGAEEGVRHPSAPERPLQHRARVRRPGRPRERRRLLQEVPRGEPEGPRRGRADRRRRSRRASRKQQAELLESQQAQRRRPRHDGPAGPARSPAAERRARCAGGRSPAEPRRAAAGAEARRHGRRRRSPEGELKTEDVFEETVVTASQGGAEPARRAELHLDHHRAGHPPLGHHEDPRAPPAPRRRRHHGDHRRRRPRSRSAASTSASSNKVLVLVDGRSVYVDLLGATLLGDARRSASRTSSASRSSAARARRSTAPTRSTASSTSSPRRPARAAAASTSATATTTRRTAPSASSGRDKETRLPHLRRLRLPAALEPRGPRRPRRRAASASNDQDTSRSARSRIDATVTRQFGKDVTVGVQGGYVAGQRRGPRRSAPINDISSSTRSRRPTSPRSSTRSTSRCARSGTAARRQRHQRRVHRAVAPARRRST